VAQVAEYLETTLAVSVVPKAWDGGGELAAYLRNTYEFLQIRLFETQCILAIDRNDEERSPAMVAQQIRQVQGRHSGVVVYVRERITSYNRQRLVQHKVPFIVPGNQMYLPMVGVDFREHFRTLRVTQEKFSPSTQLLLVALLLRGSGTLPRTAGELAKVLGYSAMTMTRAFNELEAAGVGLIDSEKGRRSLAAVSDVRTVWTATLPFLGSPVTQEFFSTQANAEWNGISAGLEALAHYSMISEPHHRVVALGPDAWKKLAHEVPRHDLPAWEPGSWQVQVWSYDPAKVMATNVVDPLSLYLSLRDDPDERVEAALEEMLKEKMGW